MPAWLSSLIIIVVVIWPLIQIERWMHRHVQGLGLLITNNSQAAVLIYYLAFAPGVLLHEISQWLMAQLLRVKVKQFRIWPEEQKGGVIRLGLVEIDQKNTDIYRATLVGVIPLITGIAAIALIGNWRFDVEGLIVAFENGRIIEGIREFMRAPDFWLWFYLLFAISNAMLPEEHDVINWWIFVVPLAVFIAFLLLLDLGILVEAFLEGPFGALAGAASFALVAALVIDLVMWLLISIAEWVLSRVLDRELEYG